MKKSLIAAGAASAVLAAMPVLGVFADGDTLTVKDQLTVTVSSSCTMDSVAPAGATSSTGNEYAASGAAGALLNFAASGGTATSFTVKCNNANGYTITPTFTDLKINGLAGAANAAQDIPYAASSSAGSKTWTAFYTKTTAGVAGTETAFTASGTAVNGTATMTDSYAFSYKVGLGADQAAGTYVGTASYILAAVPAGSGS